MRLIVASTLKLIAYAAILIFGSIRLSLCQSTASATRPRDVRTPNVAVGPQYDATHVYVAPEDFDHFVASLLDTFGGTTSKRGVLTVTPAPSSTISQVVFMPVGTVSVFGFKTPIPYPFGADRIGFLVTDMDAAIRAARATSTDVADTYHRIRIGSPFGKVAVIVTDGHLPYPYDRQTTGYEVVNLTDTLSKATSARATVVVAPYTADLQSAAIVQFPSGYIAEIHAQQK